MLIIKNKSNVMSRIMSLNINLNKSILCANRGNLKLK